MKVNNPVEIVTPEQKLSAVRSARQAAADGLFVALQKTISSKFDVSEVQLRDWWLEDLRTKKSIFPDGWYLPPPHGIGVLFGSTKDKYGGRMNYQSLRKVPPQEDIYLDKIDGIVYFYASPVDRKTGMIGDFGVVLYFGKNPEIQKHLQLCLQLNHQVLGHAQPGMSFAALTKYAYDLFTQHGLSNQVISITDPTGVNIGHTVPGSYEDWTQVELGIFRSDNWNNILTLIKDKRKFLSMQEPLQIRPGMAFTIEQRLTKPANPAIPMSSFHTIGLINPDGSKELLTDFSKIFNLMKMDYMLS